MIIETKTLNQFTSIHAAVVTLAPWAKCYIDFDGGIRCFEFLSEYLAFINQA